MCFSATSSFIVGSALTVTGVASINMASRSEEKPFAGIPLLFGLQQLTEGFVWLALENESWAPMLNVSALVFLVFAQVIWPFWVPWSVWLVEKDKIRKKILAIIGLLGAFVASYLAYCLVMFEPNVTISGHHLRYDLNFTHQFVTYSALFYVIPTVFPPIISKRSQMFLLGLVILVSFLISKFYFDEHLISVWCFFAAVLSIIVLVVVKKFNTIQDS